MRELALPCAPLSQFPYVWHFEVNGTLGVQDVVEEVAVAVVTRKLGLERGLEFERGCGGLELGVDVLVVVHRGHAVEVVHAVVLDLLAVVVRHGLLLDVRVVTRGASGSVAILVLRRNTLAQTHVVYSFGVSGVVVLLPALSRNLAFCAFASGRLLSIARPRSAGQGAGATGITTGRGGSAQQVHSTRPSRPAFCLGHVPIRLTGNILTVGCCDGARKSGEQVSINGDGSVVSP
jgi:hypothetical protein